MVLETQQPGKAEAIPDEAIARAGARYVYCSADAAEEMSLGEIGIEGDEVYTIVYQDICAVVHRCSAQPYRSDDPEVVKAWIMTHQKVVEAAWERWGTVLPLSFDTIIKGDAEKSAEQKTKDWLKQEHAELKRRFESVKGRAEYGVQVFWQPKGIAQGLAETNPEIRELKEEIKVRPEGVAYLYRQKLENLLKRQMEARATEYFQDFYRRIGQHADDIRVEKTKRAEPGWQMLMNLSCLVPGERCAELGEALDRINLMAGFAVRFTGPWPPYSFVGGF